MGRTRSACPAPGDLRFTFCCVSFAVDVSRDLDEVAATFADNDSCTSLASADCDGTWSTARARTTCCVSFAASSRSLSCKVSDAYWELKMRLVQAERQHQLEQD